MTLTVTLSPNATDVTLTPEVVTVELATVGPQGPAGNGTPDPIEVTTATVQLAWGQAYVLNNASRVVGMLPLTCPFGRKIHVYGKGAGGWRIAQNAGQTIHFDENSTTTGPAGYLASQRPFDCLTLLCITDNTDFLVTNSIGNIQGN